jgi:hypothetical protein
MDHESRIGITAKVPPVALMCPEARAQPTPQTLETLEINSGTRLPWKYFSNGLSTMSVESLAMLLYNAVQHIKDAAGLLSRA